MNVSYSLGQPENNISVPPYDVRRGFIMMPSRDLRDYVTQSLLIAAAGFTVGLGVGALFGRAIGKRHVTKQ